jgi:hypothetical protein
MRLIAKTKFTFEMVSKAPEETLASNGILQGSTRQGSGWILKPVCLAGKCRSATCINSEIL